MYILNFLNFLVPLNAVLMYLSISLLVYFLVIYFSCIFLLTVSGEGKVIVRVLFVHLCVYSLSFKPTNV